jgi:serine/threonine protein kinase
MAPATTEAPLKFRSRIQESLDGLQRVDLVECPASGRLFIDKHTFMTASTPEGRSASAAALNELDLHLSLGGVENVVKLERHSLQGERLHLLHEHCSRGDLLEIVQQELRLQTAGVPPHSSSMVTCTDASRRRVFTAVLRGVQGLHDAGIAHLDLSPENVFVTESGDVKVGDLGHAQRFKHGRPSVQVSQVAKEAYAAPELLAHREVENARQADAWSLGVILWTLCTKRALVRRAAQSDQLFCRMAERGTAVALQETGLLSQMPAALVDLLAGLLDADPKSRLSVDAALQHAWVLQETAPAKLSRRKSIGNMIKKKGEGLMKKHHRPSEKKSRVRTASAEIALESTRVTLTSRSPA